MSNDKTRTFLKNERKKRKLTQEQVAKFIGISRSRYTQIERGISDPTLKTAKEIADLFKISLEKI